MTAINTIIARLEAKHSRFKELQGSADVLKLIEAYRKLEGDKDMMCYLLVTNGIMSRMRCAQLIGKNIADLDDWIVELKERGK